MTSFFGELRRRNVVKVAVAYAIVGWLLVQIADTFFPALQLPEWTVTFVAGLVILGFPLALLLSWAYELTPDGVERTGSLPFSENTESRPRRTLEIAIIALLVLALGYVVLDNYVMQDSSDAELLADGQEESTDILRTSIAVLPFENLSPDENDAYFAAGLHEEVLNQLAKLMDLSVVSRTSVLRYPNSGLSIPEIARELNVRTIMEGTVRYADDQVAITLQLIDAVLDEHLWSRTYRQEFADIFAIQSDIAMNVANALEAELSLEEQAIVAKAPTDSSEAYKLYLQGRQLWNFRTEDAVEKALELFEQAIELDSEYALAYSGIGDVWLSRGWYSMWAPKEAFPQAIDVLTEALTLDDTLAEAQATRAHIYLEFDHNWAAAERGYLRAIELNPRYPSAHHWYGGYLSAMERHDEALQQAHEARGLNPLSPIINTWVGLRHYFAGDYPMAVQEILRALQLKPDFAPGHWHLGWAYEQAGQYDAAIASAARAMMISNNPIYLASLGHAHAKAGNEAEARRILDQLRQSSATRHVSAYHTAVIYVALDDMDESFDWLELAHEEQSPWIGYMRVDPRLDPLHSDPRFDALLTQANLDF